MTFRDAVKRVLPDDFFELEHETIIHHLCNLRIETLGVIRHKIRVLMLMFCFTFTLFVTTDGTVALAKTFKNETALQSDERMYTVYVLTIVYAVVTVVGLLVLFMYSVFNIHKIKNKLKDTHKMFAHGHGYSVIFGMGIVFYLMCVVRAILTTSCELLVNKNTPMCADARQYAGAMNMIFTILVVLLLGSVVVVTELLCGEKIEMKAGNPSVYEAVPLRKTLFPASKLSTAYHKSLYS